MSFCSSLYQYPDKTEQKICIIAKRNQGKGGLWTVGHGASSFILIFLLSPIWLSENEYSTVV